MRLAYRARQFLRSITARVDPLELTLAEKILSPELMTLFHKMAAADQAHSLRVLQELLKVGEKDPDLLAAALLHDIGKSCCPLTPFERALIVLANRARPELVIRLGQRSSRGPLRAFATAVQHPAWGAEMVEANGGSARLCALIRYHQEPVPGIEGEELRLLISRLQQADNRH